MQNKAYDILLNNFDGFTTSNLLQKQKRTIPADRNYQFFFMELINCVASDIAFIDLRANGTPVQQYQSGTDVDLMNQRQGLPASTATGGNPVLALSQRRDRLFGGALEFLTPPAAGSGLPVGIRVGDTKDLETNTSLNCGSKDASGFSISNLTLEVWLSNNGGFANKPEINLTAYGYDPFPGGPGLVKFVDQKIVNVTTGNFTFDKDTAFTLGDGQRLNMDQVLIMNPNQNVIDNIVVYWQTIPIRNRNININQFMQLLSTLNTNIATITPLFDSREMLYGDENQPIGALNSAFKITANFGTAGGYQLYQVSSGSLLPTNPGVVLANP